MRSFTLETATLTALLITVPFTGAYAGAHHNSAALSDPRVIALINQVEGVDKGIADARQAKTITPAEAQKLHMRAAHISQAAERTAAHGKIPDEQYHQLLHQLDSLDQTLRTDSGSAQDFYDGSDSGHYPNG
jgi:hypothetical protein